VRYCNSAKAGSMKATVNGASQNFDIEKTAKNEWRKARFTATLRSGNNNLLLNNAEGINMIIDQVIYAPAGTEPEKFLVTVRDVENGTVTPSTPQAAEGDTVTLRVKTEPGFKLKELKVVNSVFYTQGKTISLATLDEKRSTLTFVMPDDNVTLLPVFEETGVIAKLNFQDVVGGAIPEGWRCVQGTSDVHEYPNTYSSGARTMTGFGGYQGKGLYWREKSAEYGRQSAYPLTLEKGDYVLSFAMAAWKGTPKYVLRILDAATNAVIATTETITAKPNANGSTSANLASAALQKLEFEAPKSGKYVISFVCPSGGFEEFLLLECSLRAAVPETVEGDVNGDGAVNVADIASIISVMAGADDELQTAADVNADGKVDVADISTVITIMAANARRL